MGGLLVAAAAVGLYAASSTASGGPRHSYVVARHGVAPGTRLSAADLNRLPLDLPPALAQRAFRDTGTLEGATVVAPLAAGELVQASAVVAKSSAPGSREITFAVPRATLAPTLEGGERIDVVATFGTGVDAFSSVVSRQALVVGLDRGRERVGAGDDAAVTVAIEDPAEAVALAHAIQLGRLTVVRATGAAPSRGSDAAFRQPAPNGAGRP
ncbi:MAG: SAF domain-containing protein [Acidimicrobiales bacterium]